MLDWTERAADADFDLHGQAVLEAAANAERFLRAQAKARRGGVVRLITGRGRPAAGRRSAPGCGRCSDAQERGDVVRDYVLEEAEGSFLVRLR